MIPYTEYLLTVDDMKVSDMLWTAPDKEPQAVAKYAAKMKRLSEHNLRLMKAEYVRKKTQYQRQVKNATYWGMALDLAKEDLKGGLQ
jgi:hypothetical protein|tara:strand:+ start:353 stop:613 length:261 start_codon:yes stop_codon:yes gene_type:complete